MNVLRLRSLAIIFAPLQFVRSIQIYITNTESLPLCNKKSIMVARLEIAMLATRNVKAINEFLDV